MASASAPPAPTVPEKLRAIVAELSAEFYERGTHIETLIIGDLAGEHTYLLGPPGTGKSALVRATCARVTGARYGEVLFDRQLPLEAIFGQWDLALYESSKKHWRRNVEGFLPSVHKFFGDEVGKAGPAVLNPLLTAMNERFYHNGDVRIDIPLISFVGASNEELEPELAAIWDRFMLRMLVEPIQEPSHFADLLASAVVTKTPPAPTTVTLPELQHAITAEVPRVQLPPGIIETLLSLRVELRTEQVEPSDRRWKKSVRLLQASAYLNGRDAVDDDDLGVLEHVLWDVAEQIPMVQKKVRAQMSPIVRAASDVETAVDAIKTRLKELAGQSVETRASYGGEARFKLSELEKQVDDLAEQAARQGRSATKLEHVRGLINDTTVLVFVECMNVPPEKARKMIGV